MYFHRWRHSAAAMPSRKMHQEGFCEPSKRSKKATGSPFVSRTDRCRVKYGVDHDEESETVTKKTEVPDTETPDAGDQHAPSLEERLKRLEVDPCLEIGA